MCILVNDVQTQEEGGTELTWVTDGSRSYIFRTNDEQQRHLFTHICSTVVKIKARQRYNYEFILEESPCLGMQ